MNNTITNNINKIYEKYRTQFDICLEGVPDYKIIEEKNRIVEDFIDVTTNSDFSDSEYFMYDFCHKSKEEKSTFLPEKTTMDLFYRFNDKNSLSFNTRDKWKDYEYLKKYYKRDICLVVNETHKNNFFELLKNKHKLFCKPLCGSLGEKTKIIKDTEYLTDEKFDELIKFYEPEGFIAEEMIIQSDFMMKLNPTSVNTLRIMSIRTNDKINMYFELRIGEMFSIVDNLSYRSLICGIDPNDGTIISSYNKNRKEYKNHPHTRAKVIGEKIPRFNEAIDLAKELAEHFRGFRYLSWDLGLTDNGWVIVELNGKGGICGFQEVYNIGIRHDIEKYLTEINKPIEFKNLINEKYIPLESGKSCPHAEFPIENMNYFITNKQYLYNDKSAKIILDQLSYNHENKNEPYLLKIEDGIVLPRMVIDDGKKKHSLGGVLNKNQEFIKESKEYDFGGGYQLGNENIEKIDEGVIYLGRGFPHFGVVMIDLVRRLYYKFSDEGKNLKLCYLGIHSDPGTFGKASDRSFEFLKEMGLNREDLIDIRKPTQFKMVYIPEPGFEYEKYYHKEFIIPYKKISDNIVPKDIKKLYLSRRKMDNVKEVGEELIEKFFYINGYKIIYPDDMSIHEQVEYYKGADIIASIEYTATHNILYCKPGTRQIIIRKHTRIEPRHFLFNELMESPVTYIDCYFNYMPSFPRHYDIGPFCVIFNKNIREFAKDNNYKIPKFWFIYNLIIIIKYVFKCINVAIKRKCNGKQNF